MLAVTGIGAVVAFRLAHTFWLTADEDDAHLLWYTICVIAIVCGVILAWQALRWVRLLWARNGGP